MGAVRRQTAAQWRREKDGATTAHGNNTVCRPFAALTSISHCGTLRAAAQTSRAAVTTIAAFIASPNGWETPEQTRTEARIGFGWIAPEQKAIGVDFTPPHHVDCGVRVCAV